MKIPDKLYKQILENMPIICVDVIIKFKNKILLIKRSDEPLKDFWYLPGGRLYKNELTNDCAIRKAKEETGIDCKVNFCVGTYETIFKEVHSINFVYYIEALNTKVKLDEHSSDYMWISIKELKKLKAITKDDVVDNRKYFSKYIFYCLEDANLI